MAVYAPANVALDVSAPVEAHGGRRLVRAGRAGTAGLWAIVRRVRRAGSERKEERECERLTDSALRIHERSHSATTFMAGSR